MTPDFFFFIRFVPPSSIGHTTKPLIHVEIKQSSPTHNPVLIQMTTPSYKLAFRALQTEDFYQ